MDECGIYGVVQTIDAISGRVSGSDGMQGRLESHGLLVGEVGFPKCIYPETYDGEYEVTPTREVQILATNDRYMDGNIKVNPIPSNYGLITWDGITLTVS